MAIKKYLEHAPKIAQTAFVDDSAQVIGAVELGKDASVWPCAVLRGDMNHIHIGARSNIQDGSILHVMNENSMYPNGCPVEIGEDVSVAHGVNLHGCKIGNRCIIGIGSIVLDGAVIPDDVFIGAKSLVPQNKILESGYLYIGSPVRKARALTDKEKSFIPELANEYVKLKNQYE